MRSGRHGASLSTAMGPCKATYTVLTSVSAMADCKLVLHMQRFPVLRRGSMLVKPARQGLAMSNFGRLRHAFMIEDDVKYNHRA